MVEKEVSPRNLRCSSCSLDLPLSQFSPRNDRPRGYQSHCKDCRLLKEQEKRDTTTFSKDYYDAAIKRSKEWRKNNPSHRNHLSAKYKASKLKATPKWLTKNHIEQIKDFYFLSQDCANVSGDDYHVDHIIPLRGKNVCGLHVPWNLQVLPADINRKKNRYYVG